MTPLEQAERRFDEISTGVLLSLQTTRVIDRASLLLLVREVGIIAAILKGKDTVSKSLLRKIRQAGKIIDAEAPHSDAMQRDLALH